MNYFTFPNYGVLTHKFSNEELAPVWNEINEIKDSNFTVGENFGHLVHSNIEHKFKLIKCRNELEQLMIPFVEAYEKETNYVSREMKMNTKLLSLTMNATWVNFQKKHEFNPTHSHAGMFSFVLWIDIPFKIEDEYNVFPNMNIKDNRAASFTFHYTNTLGRISEYVLPADTTWKNKIVVFPAQMTHSVNPFFTSDEYRVSVSGNFRLSA
jgi:hypothetical protein